MEDNDRRITDLETHAEKLDAVVRDLEKSVADLKHNVQSFESVQESVLALKAHVQEIGNWKMKLTYPFAAIGLIVTGLLMAVGAWVWNAVAAAYRTVAG